MTDWQETTLGEVVELKRGYDLPQHNRSIGSVPVVSSSGISGHHFTAMVKGPGVVTGRYGTLGEVFYIGEDFWPLNTTLYVRDFKGNDPRFIGYFLKTIDILAYSDKAAVPGLNRNHLHQARVRVPTDVDEQRRIGEVLGAFDDKIELNRRMSETLDAIARALFKSWFVDFEQFEATQQTEIGPIPSGWDVLPVSQIATYVNGGAYRAFEPNEERRGLPIVKIAELKAGVTAQTRFSDVAMPDKFRIDSGDMLFSWSGNPDTSIDVFLWTHGPAWLNQHIFRVVPAEIEHRAFVYWTLRHLRPVFAEIARNKQTTGLGHVTAADLRALKVVRPPSFALQRWNEIAHPLMARVEAIQHENQTLLSLRDSLLPRLVFGELRIRDAEAVAIEAAL